MGTDFRSMLGSMKKNYAESQNQFQSMFGGVKIPDGEYIAKLTKAEGTVSQAGRPMVKREHVVTEGDNRGTIIYDNLVLDTEYGLVFLRKWFDSLGLEAPEDIAEIPDYLDSIIDMAPLVRIKTKQSGDFVNVNVIELLGSVPPEDEDEDEIEEVAGLLGLDDLTRAELKSFIKENGLDIKVTAKMDEDDLRSAIREALDTPEEVAEEDAAEGNEEDSQREALLAFCQSQGVDVEDEETLESVKAALEPYEFPEADLTEDEAALLRSVDLESCIEVPAPKKPAAKKK